MKRIWKMLCTAAMIAATNIVFLCALLPSAGQRACAYALAGVLLLLLNLFPPAEGESTRLRVLSGGVTLLRQFLIVCAVDLAGAVLIWLYCVPDVLSGARFAAHAAVAACALFLIFWNGIIRLYCTSVQLGLRLRVAGALAGWIPVVNLFVLGKLIAAAADECRFENNTVRRDRARAKDAVCRTRYPLLLVHGVFFRDSRALNYWGRIPGTAPWSFTAASSQPPLSRTARRSLRAASRRSCVNTDAKRSTSSRIRREASICATPCRTSAAGSMSPL